MIKREFKRFSSFFLLLIADFAAFLLAFYLAYLLRFYTPYILDSLEGVPLFSLSHYYDFWWMPLICFCIFFYEGLYERSIVFWDELKLIIKATTLSVVVLIVIVTLTKEADQISRLMLALFWMLCIVIFPVIRFYLKKIVVSSRLFGENVLFVGKDGLSNNLDRELKKIGFHIALASSPKDILSKDVPRGIKTVIVDEMPHEELMKLYELLQKRFAEIIYLPENSELAFLNVQTKHILESQIFLIKIKNNLRSPSNKIVKRLFDIFLFMMAFPFLLPVFALIFLLIRIDSKGSAFFVQDRIGEGGRRFGCVKFRTMYQDNEEILQHFLQNDETAKREWATYKKLKGKDPRVTKIGAILRRYSLDELPQILNVALGSMSMVGPRPYLEKELVDMDGKEGVITLSKPGITGLWQISGRNRLTFKRRLELDEWYVRNWSLWLDFVIILKTFKVIVKKEGAY